jgi:hypothetical protein
MDELMRRLTAFALAATLSVSGVIVTATAQLPPLSSIAGTVQSAAGQTVGNIAVQLRDLTTGRVAGTTSSSSTGTFGFSAVVAGSYSVELVNAVGQVVGASAAISVAAGAVVSGVMVTASAAAAGAPPAAASGSLVTTAVIVMTAAAAIGIAGVVAVRPVASPSR